MRFFEKYNVQEEDYKHYKDVLDKRLEIGGLVLTGVELTLFLAYYTVFTKAAENIIFIGSLAGLGIIILISAYLVEIIIINNAQQKNKPLPSYKTMVLAICIACSYALLLSPLMAVVVSAIALKFIEYHNILLIYTVVFIFVLALYLLIVLSVLHLLTPTKRND